MTARSIDVPPRSGQRLPVVLVTILVVLGGARRSSLAPHPGSPATIPLKGNILAWSPDGARFALAAKGSIEIRKARDPLQVDCVARLKGARPDIKDLAWSPDGRRLAVVAPRASDQWDTIWLTDPECADPADVLPPGAPVNRPGVRAIRLAGWTGRHELSLVRHCGTGCVVLDILDTESGGLRRVCAGEGSFHWDRDRRQAVVDTHLGGLALVERSDAQPLAPERPLPPLNDCRPVIAGCAVSNGTLSGTWQSFEGWSPDGRSIAYRRVPCREVPPTGPEGTLSLWEVETGRHEDLVGMAGRASWSLDGRQIAVTLLGTLRRDARQQVVGTDLFSGRSNPAHVAVIDRRDRSIQVVGSLGTAPAQGSLELFLHDRPVWSPDGTRFVVRDVEGGIVLVDLEDATTVRLRNADFAHATIVDVAWSPDGDTLAVADRLEKVVLLDMR